MLAACHWGEAPIATFTPLTPTSLPKTHFAQRSLNIPERYLFAHSKIRCLRAVAQLLSRKWGTTYSLIVSPAFFDIHNQHGEIRETRRGDC